MTSTRVTYRARVLRAINTTPGWQTARDVAASTGLHYSQTIFALNALLNAGHIARHGKKSTSRWGSVALATNPTAEALSTLSTLFPHAADHP